jgi:hypothetical protein
MAYFFDAADLAYFFDAADWKPLQTNMKFSQCLRR